MPRFLAIFTGTADVARRAEAEGRVNEAEGMRAWGAWMEEHKDRIVDAGGPLGKTKAISPQGIADITNTAAAYVVVEAESHEAAAEMFRGHAHFTHFPGDSVEVMPILPMPGQ
ncbi:hypothetical protein EMQ25_01270 [Arsenicitalea aurantiaca]|uniref:YCII-related domain-containing protein n=1 Tax=Arsenicitalea aurantiaca TaxID=1783274 RepID=A0A433XKP6_9HYPH|nr:hypothetical protein [Arsenicitalea aurantiaca]RUT34623.1 hypothetical protein EMQ25_01270 [Arsenicitalea aurantiaca]